MRRRGRLLLLAVALVALGVTAVVVVVLARADRGAVAAQPGAAATQPSPSATGGLQVHTGGEAGERGAVEEVARLLTGLPAAIAAGQTSWLADDSPVRSVDVHTLLPAGSTVTVDGASWRRTGAVASVDAVVAGTEKPRVRVVLVRQPEGWRVSETFQGGGS